MSTEFRLGMVKFSNWLDSHEYPVTIFLIADMLDEQEFVQWLNQLIENYGDRVNFACHGLEHKSWSAWGENAEDFTKSLTQSIAKISSVVGSNFKPWFRAPAGYMAPWMASCLKNAGIVLDSSVNDTILTRNKAGKGNTWRQVADAVEECGLVERAWLTRWKLPVNGPALSLFPLSINAKLAWRKLPKIIPKEQINTAPEDKKSSITTVYWHILDHSRKQGKWQPPIPKFD